MVVPQPPKSSPLPIVAGLVLSPAAELIPRKLVYKVQSGQFVEMRELLTDNISLVHQLESIQGFLNTKLAGGHTSKVARNHIAVDIDLLLPGICGDTYLRHDRQRSVGIPMPHRLRGPRH